MLVAYDRYSLKIILQEKTLYRKYIRGLLINVIARISKYFALILDSQLNKLFSLSHKLRI